MGKDNGDTLSEIQRQQEVEVPEATYFRNGLDLETDPLKESALLKSKAREEHAEQKAKCEKADFYAKEWRRVAEVFDRLFFWLFLLAILISTLVLFHPLTDSYIRDNQLIER